MGIIRRRERHRDSADDRRTDTTLPIATRALVVMLVAAFLFPADWVALHARKHIPQADTPLQETPIPTDSLLSDTLPAEPPHGATALRPDSIQLPDSLQADLDLTVVVDENSPYGLDGKIPFNPDPTRAVWLSALFPGLGQVYNRRYWKLPIIVAGFMGLAYGTSWNNGQYGDYTQGYRDLLDSDPSTNSYMNFFPPTVKEDDLDLQWLTTTMKNRKDYYRRNRDLCIICLVGLYLICMVDAYVDASLAHFDISPGLSMDVAPAVMLTPTPEKVSPTFGLNWAFTF